MSLQSELQKILTDVEPCHFPPLIFGRTPSPTVETYVSSLRFPAPTDHTSAWFKALSRDDALIFAFALLLKAYTRIDALSCGILTDSQSRTNNSARQIAHLLRVDLNSKATLSSNYQALTKVALTSELDGNHWGGLRDLEAEAGFKLFNTTLSLTPPGLRDQSFENVFGSSLALCAQTEDVDDNPQDEIKIFLHYSTDLLDVWCAQNVLATFQSILTIVATEPDGLLENVTLMSTRDEQLIKTWNAKVPHPANQTLNEHFEKIFDANVDKEVVYSSEGCFTYGELDKLSTFLAIRLMQLGLKRNMVVPICMDKSRWGTCAMVSVWKAGGALSTMDPTYPDDRLFVMMNDLDAKIVISDRTHASRFEKLGVHVISDMDELPTLLESSALPVDRVDAWTMGGVKPDDLAFVAWTSGSSGKPKGVLHTHNRLTSEHESYKWNLEYNGGARILQFGSYAYIAGVGDNFRAMLHGATLCVPSESERTSALADFINRSGATRSYMTPSVIRTLNPSDVTTLKHLCVGGEPIDRDLENLWAGHVHFLSLYGASEGGFMIKQSANPQYRSLGLLSVGGLSWLVDPTNVNKLVPIGALGEIVFESYELATGYLNDPEKTAQTFINAPAWAPKRGTSVSPRYLRMGDLGRYETDGSMSIYGRVDTQVKIHGQRVELQDVEYNLRAALPSGSEAVVELVKPFDAPDRPLLVAFCCLHNRTPTTEMHPGLKPNIQAIVSIAQEQLKRLLPQHMVPRAFIFLEQLPGGYKTDRKKLRTDASTLGYASLIQTALLNTSSEIQEPPCTNKERVLAGIWAELLHRDVQTIQRRDHFVALGGDSLAAIRLVSKARAGCLQLTTQSILSHPILQDMAELATAHDFRLENGASASNGFHHNSAVSDVAVTLKATDLQAWAASVGAQNGGWIDHFVYDFSGPLNTEKLVRSCKRLVENHSILRSIFTSIEGEIYVEFPTKHDTYVSTYEVAPAELEKISEMLYAKDRISPLGSSIVRFNIIKASPNRHRLIIRVSHAQYDGFCAPMFCEHLRLLYFSQNLPRTLPFQEYLRQIQDAAVIQDSENYWRAQLEGSQIPQLVRRKNTGPPFENTLDGELQMSVTEPDLRNHGMKTATLVKAAWALVLCSLSESSDVVFGDFISGRQMDIGEIETVVGPCANFMPVRIKVPANSTNLGFLKQVQADFVSAIPHESLGFRHIIRRCTSWGSHARYSSIVNFVNVAASTSETQSWIIGDNEESKLDVTSIYEEKQHDKTDLWLLCLPGNLAPNADSKAHRNEPTLDLYFRYSTKLYTNDAIEQISSLFIQSLNSFTKELDSSVSIPRLTDKKRSELVPSVI